MQTSKRQLFEMHAELCGMMANATRLAIIETLHRGERSVTDIAAEVGASITTVSQHLRLLRDKHVVMARKDAQSVFYSLRDPRMIDACNLIRTVLVDSMKSHGAVAADVVRPRKRRLVSH